MYMHNTTTEYGLKKKSVPCPWYLLCFVQRVFICLSLLPDHIKMLYIDAELFCHTFWSFWQFDSLYCLDKFVMSPSVIGVMDLFINCCPQSFTINCFFSYSEAELNVYKHVDLDVWHGNNSLHCLWSQANLTCMIKSNEWHSSLRDYSWEKIL